MVAVPEAFVQSPAANGSLEGLYFSPTMTTSEPTATELGNATEADVVSSA